MKKAEVIAKINPTSTYIGSKVRGFINEVTCEDSLKPKYLKKADVIIVQVGVKTRPSVVIKVCKDYVIAIPLTTTINVHVLYKSSSRFFKEGFFCNQYTIVPTELAMESFVGIYDNSKVLNNAIKALRAFINEKI